AGAGGPALTVYAVATGWAQESFAATAQVSFAVQSAASLAVGGLPQLSPPRLAVVVGAAAAGLAAGQIVAGRSRPGYARWSAVILALLAALGTVIKGIVS